MSTDCSCFLRGGSARQGARRGAPGSRSWYRTRDTSACLTVFGTPTAPSARLADVQLAFLRGVHNDRDHRGVGIALDRLDGLEAVHAGHQGGP